MAILEEEICSSSSRRCFINGSLTRNIPRNSSLLTSGSGSSRSTLSADVELTSSLFARGIPLHFLYFGGIWFLLPILLNSFGSTTTLVNWSFWRGSFIITYVHLAMVLFLFSLAFLSLAMFQLRKLDVRRFIFFGISENAKVLEKYAQLYTGLFIACVTLPFWLGIRDASFQCVVQQTCSSIFQSFVDGVCGTYNPGIPSSLTNCHLFLMLLPLTTATAIPCLMAFHIFKTCKLSAGMPNVTILAPAPPPLYLIPSKDRRASESPSN